MLIEEIIFFTLPLFITGLLHHFIIIRYNLFTSLSKPVDFGLILNKRRLFGDSKTLRGFIVVISFTGLFMLLISLFFDIPLRYNAFVSGSLLGLGYSLGELPNSFLKRRLGIKESGSARGSLGKLFYFLDHTDSIIGTLVFLPLIYPSSTSLIITLFFIGTLLHILVDKALYKFSYKKLLKQFLEK